MLGNNQTNNINVENSGENQGLVAAVNNAPVVIQNGLNYTDTKSICMDIVKEELAKYHNEASIEAKKRNEELFEKVISKLQENKMTDADALNEFKNPAMQYDYAEAQKAYIKAGTPELAAVLSDILVRRLAESSRTLLQISLGEAIQIAPKLVKSQMATLALIFVLEHTRSFSINDHISLSKHLRQVILPLFQDGVSNKDSEFQHLMFTGCSQQTAFTRNLIPFIKSAYPGLFMTGFHITELPKDHNGMNIASSYPSLFTQCLNAPEKVQINAMEDDYLSELLTQLKMPDVDQRIVKDLFKNNLLSDENSKKILINLVPEMNELFEYWESSQIKHCILSSVGIVIGAQYSHLVTGQEYNLGIWI